MPGMRIGDLVTASMGNIGLVQRPRQTSPAVLALAGSGDDSGTAKPNIAPTRTALKNPTIDDVMPVDTGDGDTVDLSTGAIGKPSGASTTNKPADSSSALAGLVEKFIRKRAILAYHQPGRTALDPSFDFVMEVEIAYRVIEPTQPGTTLDIQA